MPVGDRSTDLSTQRRQNPLNFREGLGVRLMASDSDVWLWARVNVSLAVPK